MCRAAEQAASTGGATAPRDALELVAPLNFYWAPNPQNWCMRNCGDKLGVKDTAGELPVPKPGLRWVTEWGGCVIGSLPQ